MWPGPAPPMMRAVTNRTSTSTSSTSAPVHARGYVLGCASGSCEYTMSGSAVLRVAVERIRVEDLRCSRAVRSSGAVSPIDAGDAEDHRGDEAGSCGRQHDVPRRSPLASTERERRLAQTAGNEPQHELGGAGDRRQHQHRQRERGREARRMLKCSCTMNAAKMNRPATIDGMRAHRVDDHAHRPRQPPADLVQEHRGRDSERHREEHRQADLLERADDRARRAARTTPTRSTRRGDGPR